MSQSVFKTRIGASETRTLRGDRGTSTPVFDPNNGGAQNIDLHVNVLQPGTGPGPRHYHAHTENAYLVLEGEITVELEDETVVLGPEEGLLIPPGVVHATMNRTDRPARFIEIYAPAGKDFHIVDPDWEGKE